MSSALTPDTKVYVCDDKGPCSRRTVKSTRAFKHRTKVVLDDDTEWDDHGWPWVDVARFNSRQIVVCTPDLDARFQTRRDVVTLRTAADRADQFTPEQLARIVAVIRDIGKTQAVG
jgi:hypothetical protein